MKGSEENEAISRMHIETISTLDALKPFEQQWNEAVSRSSFDSVFATYE